MLATPRTVIAMRRAEVGVRFLGALLIASALVSGGADAQDRPRIGLDHRGGTSALAPLRARASELARDEFTRRGYEVLSPGEVGAAAFERVLECDDTACMRPLLDALGVEFFAVVTMWDTEEGDRRLEATLYPRGGRMRIVSIGVDRQRVEQPAVDLVTGLIERNAEQSALPTPTADLGVVVSSGSPFEPAASEQAVAEPETEDHVDRPSSRRSPWNYALGGTLVAVGLIPTSLAISTARNDGDCVEVDAMNRCVVGESGYRVRDFGRLSVAELSIGVAAIGAGVFMLASRPIRVAATVSPDSASATVSGSF